MPHCCSDCEKRFCCVALAVTSSTWTVPASSAERPSISPSALSSATSNQNVEPLPGVESTPMRPPIRVMMRLQIASPRPVPPKVRVVEASACEKAWNSCSAASVEMPMPVSRTSKRSWLRVRVSPRRLMCTLTLPRSVNLIALLTRLVSTWRSRTGSPRITGRTLESIARPRRRPLASALFSISRSTPELSSRRLMPTFSSCSLLASSLE